MPVEKYYGWIKDEQSNPKKIFINQTETAGTGERENPGKALQPADRGTSRLKTASLKAEGNTGTQKYSGCVLPVFPCFAIISGRSFSEGNSLLLDFNHCFY